MRFNKIRPFAFITLLIISITVSYGQRSITKISNERFQIQIDREVESPIRILQVTDLHLGGTDEGKWKKDLITLKRISKLVEIHDPDMIAITGDLFTGEKPFGALLAAYAVNFFDALDRPWLYVFGNHDPEGGFGRQDIAEVFAESQWGILGKHKVETKWGEKYDYVVDVTLNDQKKPAWQIYAFDSGSEKGNKSIKEDQLEWYKNISERSSKTYNEQIRAISIFHIPLIEYQYLIDDKSIIKQGESREKVYYEEDDGSVYKSFLEVGNIEAAFCGHDHYNNYWGEYKGGIILAYGYISGVSTNYAWPPGGKLIYLPVDGGDITMKNVAPDLDE